MQIQRKSVLSVIDHLVRRSNIEGLNRPLNAQNVSYLDIIPEDGSVLVSTEKTLMIPESVVKDGNHSAISVLRLPDGSFLLKIRKFNRIVPAKTMHEAGLLVDLILGKASQFGTVRVHDQFILDWTTYHATFNPATEIWEFKDIGRIAIEFAFNQKNYFAMIAEGRLVTVDWNTLQNYLAQPTFAALAEIIIQGIAVEPGVTLNRGDENYIFATNGQDIFLYARDFEMIKFSMQAFTVMPTIGDDGEIDARRFTTLIEDHTGITVNADVDPATRNDAIFRRFTRRTADAQVSSK